MHRRTLPKLAIGALLGAAVATNAQASCLYEAARKQGKVRAVIPPESVWVFPSAARA